MAQIRPKQIKLDTIGDLITADAATKGEVLPLGAVNTVLTSDMGTTDKPIWSYVTALRDSSGNLALDVISGGDNHLTIAGGSAGSTPELTAVGPDTNIDIELTPKGNGEVLVPVSYVPTSSNALITKEYADSIASGLDPKESVRVATTGPGTLASDFEAGDVIDGVTLAVGDRILIKDQADPIENGIYTVNATGAPTRAEDQDGTPANEASGGNFTFVEAGGQEGTGWVVVWDGILSVDTDPMNWTQFSESTSFTIAGGDGIDVGLVGSTYTVSVDADEATITATGGTGDQLASRDVNNVGTGTILTSQGSGSDAIWQGIDLSGTNTVLNNELGVTDGGTGLSTIPQGSVLVANSPDTLTALDGGTGSPTANQVLIYNYITDQLEWQDASGIIANAYGQVNGNSGSATASTNSDQITIAGTSTGGISTTAANGSPDTLDIEIDFDNLSSVSTISGTDEIIIDQGAGPVKTNIAELISDVSDAYVTITGDTGSATASGQDTLNFTGTGGIATTVANGTPDSVTIDLDFSTLPVGSAGQIDGTEQIIINDGGTNTAITISDITDSVSDRYNTITDGTNTETAALGGDTITFADGSGVALTVSSPDTVTADIDFSTLTVVSSTSGTDQIIIDQGSGPVVATLDDIVPNVVAYTTIGGNTGTTTAATLTDTLNIIGNTVTGITTTATEPGTDQVEIELDMTGMTSVSVIAGSNEIIIDQGSGPVKTTIDEVFGDLAPSYGTIGADTGSVSAVGTADTVNIVGTGGIATTGAEGSPDTLTVDLDFSTLPTGSAGSIDGTEEIIINDGGTNTAVTINDLISANVLAYTTLSGDVGSATADTATTALNIVGTGGNVVTITEPGTDTVTIDLDISSLPAGSSGSLDGTEELIIDDGGTNTRITINDLISANVLAYTTITGDSGSATAGTATDTLNIGGSGGIVVTVSEPGTDNVDIDLDIPSLPDASVGSIDGTEEIVISDGGTNQRATLNEVFQAAGVGVVGEDESVATGGANEAFAPFFSNTPIDDAAITVFFNGLALRPSGWTRSGTTLTLVDIVNGYSTEAGDIISARYEY